MNKKQLQSLKVYRVYSFRYLGRRYTEQGSLIACSCCSGGYNSAGTWEFQRYVVREYGGLCVDLVTYWCSACVESTIAAQWPDDDELTLQHMLLGRVRGETLVRAERDSKLITYAIKPGRSGVVSGGKIGTLLIGELEREKTTP
jgi:hypothetical protein